MDEKLSKLKDQIGKIESLKKLDKWGPEYQLWEKITGKLVEEIFGEDELKLFQQQNTVTFSYIDEDYNWQQYFRELDNRRRILEGLLENVKEHESKNTDLVNNQIDILKEIWRKESALKENLLTTQEAQALQISLFNKKNFIFVDFQIPSI